MSGFAHVTGQTDGPPTLPPFFLADGVAAQSATYAVMMALYHRDVRGGGGQLIDVNLIEPLARLIETSTLTYNQLGKIPGRVGNRLDASAPRNAYRTADDQWVAISSASPNLVVRILPGRRPGRPWPRTPTTSNRSDAGTTRSRSTRPSPDWIAKRTLDDVMAVFEAAEVAAAPIYDARQLLSDEAPVGERHLHPGRRPGLRHGDRSGARRGDERDPGPGGPPRAGPRRGQRRDLRWPARDRRRAPRGAARVPAPSEPDQGGPRA